MKRRLAARAKARKTKQRTAGLPPGVIAVPCVDWAWIEFLHAFLQMEKPTGTTHILSHGAATIAAKRISAVEGFLAAPSSYQWILFLDSDMTPPPETIPRLLATGHDIVSAVCVKRKPPYHPCVGTYDADGTLRPLGDFGGPQPVQEVDWAGTACLLVRRRVLETLSPPWFEADASGEGSDIDFCAKARAGGFKIYCDTRMWVGHVGTVSIDLERAFAWHQSLDGRDSLKRSCGKPTVPRVLPAEVVDLDTVRLENLNFSLAAAVE